MMSYLSEYEGFTKKKLAKVIGTFGCEIDIKIPKHYHRAFEKMGLASKILRVKKRAPNLMTGSGKGDTLVVTTLSLFARSISDLWKNVERFDAKGVAFQILDMNLDTSTPTGKLLLTMLGAVYQFEREIPLERQLVVIEKAKQEGKFKGLVPTAKRKSGDI